MNTNVRFSSDVRTGNPFVDEVKAVYLPAVKKGSAMIVLHGFTMDKGSFLDVGRTLNQMEASSLHLDLPYHGERGINGDGYRHRLYSADEIALGLKQAEADIRKSVDWLQGQGHTNIGIGGYSMGAILTLLALGKEPRLKLGVAVCGGGDLADIILNSPISFNVAAGLRKKGETYPSLSHALREVEPCNYAHNIPANRLVMINGIEDNIVLPSNSVKFISKLKNPQNIEWQQANHSTWKLCPFVHKPIKEFIGGKNAD